jgi:hypothetical protein
MVLRGRSSYLIRHDLDSVYLFKINMRGPKPVGKVFSYLKAGYMIYMFFLLQYSTNPDGIRNKNISI